MNTLSSCYFCGVALDEPLDEYPVVPPELRDDGETTTATLCPSCHRKLETILDEVLAATDVSAESRQTVTGKSEPETPPAGESGLEADTSERESTPETEPMGATRSEESPSTESSKESESDDAETDIADAADILIDPESPSAGDETTPPDGPDRDERVGDQDGDVSTDGVDAEAGQKGGGDEPVDAEHAETTRDENVTTQDDTDRQEDDEEVTAADIEAMAGDVDPGIVADDEPEESDEDDDLQAAMEPDVPAPFQSESDAFETEQEESADDTGADERRSASRADNEVDTGQEDESEAGHEDDDHDITAGSEVDDDTDDRQVSEDDESQQGHPAGENRATGDQSEVARTTISALEYNKVMRLLQNREFPVDRAEIESVAASAYELGEDECAEVIDLAIDRGLMDEMDGKLVRP